MPINAAVVMDLPSWTDPEGILAYLIAFVLVSAIVLLVLFATGVWSA